jgi:UDP-glucuronate decarboxylase
MENNCQNIINEDISYIISNDLSWPEFSDKTILITGANGFLPAYMVETLLNLKKHIGIGPSKIICLVRNIGATRKRFAEYKERNDLEWIVQDVCAPVEIKCKIDYIIHAASQASPKYYGIDPVGTLSANVLGTANMLNLAVKNNVKGFLFFSSGEVYGHVDSSQIPLKENLYGYIDPLDIRSCYGESKRLGETMCVSWMHQYGVPVKIIRIFHTYGPGMKLDDGRVFADFVSDIVNGRDIGMRSDGKAIRAFCYLSDAIIAFFTVFLKGEVGQAYNIGNDEAEISIVDLANLLVNLYPEKKLKVIKQDESAILGYLKSPFNRHVPDINKIKQLGWCPQIDLNEGFRRTIGSFL